jgi:hypothetical protein
MYRTWQSSHEENEMSLDIHLSMDDTALAPFRAAWERAAGGDAGDRGTAVVDAARAHHAGLRQGSVPDYLRSHVDLIPDIADLLGDPDWQLDAQARSGLTAALAYFTDPADLIPDSHPRFGLLDDAIVIELALTEHRRDWLAWQEFAATRREYPGIGPMDRQRWTAMRRELPRLLNASRRVSYVESRYAPSDRRTRYRMLDDLPRLDMH